MDNSTVYLAVALAAALLIGGFLLATVIRNSAAYRSVMRAVPPVLFTLEPGDVSPAELGYLAGGRERAAEVAVMGAFLSGRIRNQDGRGFFVLGDPLNPGGPEQDGLQRSVVETVQASAGARGSELVRRTAAGEAVDVVRSSLVGRGLIAHTPALDGLLARRSALQGWTVAVYVVAAGAATAGIAAGMSGFGWAPAVVVAGLFLGLLAVAAYLVLALTGGARPTVNTRAGADLVARAQGWYPAAETMTHEQAQRHVAVTGLRGLYTRRAPGAAAHPVYAHGDGAVGGADGGAPMCGLEDLAGFARACQGGTEPVGAGPDSGVGPVGSGSGAGAGPVGGIGGGGGFDSSGWFGGGGDSGGGGGGADGGGGGGG
ncbi:TIGR04222 domain-containing membrane protein [Nocardiopsis sp. LOL_012]|uniref:TIGR04222 domain-containing membrane protein n=1 Tax=Nocardiopsis sp. LOL_012 TaxID=3345409 RepID=UPI003A86CC6F